VAAKRERIRRRKGAVECPLLAAQGGYHKFNVEKWYESGRQGRGSSEHGSQKLDRGGRLQSERLIADILQKLHQHPRMSATICYVYLKSEDEFIRKIWLFGGRWVLCSDLVEYRCKEINIDCRSARPGANSVFDLPDAIEKQRRMREAYADHIQNGSTKGQLYNKSAVCRLHLSENDLFLVVCYWGTPTLTTHPLENVILVPRKQLEELYSPSLLSRLHLLELFENNQAESGGKPSAPKRQKLESG